MELHLEVVLSSSIKRKKPWPRFCWLGQEKESVFLLDDKRISEIHMVSGRTKRKIPKLHPLLNNVVTMRSSTNGMWLCGLLETGELFMWNRDKDLLKSTPTAPAIADLISYVQGNATRLYLQVSGDGMRVLLVSVTGQAFLWQCVDVRDFMGARDCIVKGNWTEIQSSNETLLPTAQDKEARVHALFVQTEALGDACLSTFVYTSGNKLIISCLQINWGENQEKVGPVSYNVKWATKSLPMSAFKPPCQPVKSRGAIVPALSPDGQHLAIVINQRQPQDTQVLFVSMVNFVSVTRNLGGCGCKRMDIPSKYSRSYWVACVSWSAGGLFLTCVLKRGSLLMLARLGGLLTLSTSGCNIDFGPAHFLPLHPLVTYRPPSTALNKDASLSSSSLSVRDVMRQRYSVTCHPQKFYLIVSDGYMATVVRVLDKISPAQMFKMLLKDTSVDLERASQSVENSQKPAKVWLDSVSSLILEKSLPNLASASRLKTTDITSTEGSEMPYFLQDLGSMGNPMGLLETVQNFFEDDSDLDGVPAGSHVEDGGRLEFASMFDTLHALKIHYEPFLYEHSEQESTGGKKITCEMEKIQSKLLTAWAFGMAMRNCVESKSPLWIYAIKCAVRFIALSQLMPTFYGQCKNAALFTMEFLRKLLYFVPWERASSQGTHSLGLMVELCGNLVQLMLSPYTEYYQKGICEISSSNISAAIQVLEMISQALDQSYPPQRSWAWCSGKDPTQLLQPCLLDLYAYPHLQNEIQEDSSVLHETQPCLAQPSRRLNGVWRFVYTVSQKYLEELQKHEGCEREKQQLVVIMCKIQAALQSAGERLEEGTALLNYTGEHLFLSGLHSRSSEILWTQLLELSAKSDKSSAIRRKRLSLALLYCLLSQYRLKEAQELGDHMASVILQDKRQNDPCEEGNTTKSDTLQCMWLSKNLDIDTACAVVQTLGRFMALYFSNQTLYIIPPHSVDVLPPIHVPKASNIGRLVPLCQEEVAKAVRAQHLSEIWTVEYAQDLLLLGGLLPESVWLAYHLGDWKAAISLSLAYSSYCIQHFDFTAVHKKELHLPQELEAASIFQAELKRLLRSIKHLREMESNLCVSDPVDEDDWGLLQVSLRDILKASVMAGVDLVSSPLSSLLDKVKDLCSSLTAMVPTVLYLPSPPLYCPQPSSNTQDAARTSGYLAEVTSRHKISFVIQQILLLLRSSHCCYSAAQWYLSKLRRARHVLFKIKKKYCYPNADQEEKSFPDGLMKFINRSGYFRTKKDMDPATIQIIICFRELCGLCWMLHVRDQFSITCRRYQADRQHIPEESEVRSTCVDALQWAQRFLPFSQFLNCEDLLQDTLLSLLSEMPPVNMVADVLAVSFPREEESVRVSLREKYNSLLQALRQCNVIDSGKETGEMWMVVIQDKLRFRKKHLGRLRRHLASLELHLWEKETTEEGYKSKHGMAMLKQLSLETSLSSSTLTDCGLLPLHSDAENAFETPVCPNLQNTSIRTKKHEVCRKEGGKTVKRGENVITEEGDAKQRNDQNKSNVKHPSLPSVGSWEFELEDEEYLNFLELFLGYLLEKDTTDCPRELPLLKGFSETLREKELHSLTFEVLTTMHRSQRDGHYTERKNPEPPIFRAGSCFTLITQDSTMASVLSSPLLVSKNEPSFSCSPQVTTAVHKGLFGRRKQQREFSQRNMKSSHPHSKPDSFKNDPAAQHSSSCLGCCTVVPLLELKQGIDTKLEAQFPELGRLLEWMMRWADRRLLRGQHGQRKDQGLQTGETVDGGVVIRVKASTTAVLTSLTLMEQRYTGLLKTSLYKNHLQVPEMQWIVTPVIEPPTDPKVEREVNPVSANTLSTVVTSNLQQEEVSVVPCAGVPEDQSFLMTHLMQDHDVPHSPSSAVASQSNELDISSLEDNHSENNSLECSSSISTKLDPGRSLKLADLENSTQNLHRSASSLSDAVPNVESQTTDKPTSVGSNIQSVSQDAELPGTQPPPAADCPAASSGPDQAAVGQTPQMRQRLGEDLYRLVQNINYMSLMEVLGASFSNLQLAQQNVTLAQSNLNSNANGPMNLSNVPPIPSPLVTCCHRHQPNPPPETPVSPDQPSMAIQQNVNLNCQTTTSGAVSSCPVLSGDLEMVPLSVQAGSPVRNIGNTLIPLSEGLLTTAELKKANHRVPVLPQSNCSMQNDPAQLLSGLRLLQLRPPQLPTYVPRQGPLPPQNYTSHESSPSRFKGNDQTEFSRNRGNAFVDAQHQPVPVDFSLDPRMLSRFKGHEVTPQTLRVQAASTPPRLRLLQVPPVSSSNTALPKLRMKNVLRPPTSISVPIGELPRIMLLHIDPQPKMMLPQQASLSQTALLTPEKFSALGKNLNYDDAQLQLQTAEKPEDYKPTSFQNSNKRQKRRGKKGDAGKAEVTFRPNESIIPPEKTNNDTEAATASENAFLEHESPVPSRPLKAQEECLVKRAFATAAELHAFASMSKKPPERHDVFTNTDPDDSVYAVRTSNETESPIIQRRQTIGNDAVHEQQLQQLTEADNHIQDGCQFISVMDLEDKSQHQDLPPSLDSQPSFCAEPTAAELHVMATRVLRNDDAQTSLDHQNNTPSDQASASCPEELVVHSHLILEDDLDFNHEVSEAEICGALTAQALSQSRFSPQPTAWFTSQMSQLDIQLAALQDIADSLETDFSKSRMLVNITSKSIQVPTSLKSTKIDVKKTVRLQVPPERKAWEPHNAVSTEASAIEPVHAAQAGLTGSVSPPTQTHTFPELSDICNNSVGYVNEEGTGLSDTLEILDQLVKEGVLSPTDLDLSTSNARHQSRSLESKSEMLQKHALPEDERRELRIWMRKKQRERFAVYQKQRKDLREMEHSPFSSGTFKSVKKNLSVKTKVEPCLLLNNFNQRMQEACNLATDLSDSHPLLQGFSDTPGTFTVRSTSALPFDRTYRVNSPSELHRPCSVTSKRAPSDEYHKRLGIDRPVTTLPRDRLSQVTRRGMVTSMRSSKSNAHIQESKASKGSPSRSTAVGENKASDPYMILGDEDTPLDLAELNNEQRESDYPISGGTQWDWVDNLSETGSSTNLSKIDWAAIERIVSEES